MVSLASGTGSYKWHHHPQPNPKRSLVEAPQVRRHGAGRLVPRDALLPGPPGRSLGGSGARAERNGWGAKS